MDKKDLATWLDSLSKEEREVVKLRFGIDGETKKDGGVVDWNYILNDFM